MSDLYRENILDHYKNPQNFGELEGVDAHSHESNPLCGDELDVFLKFDSDVVSEVGFTGAGCAISMSAMSMLSEELVGKTRTELASVSYDDIVRLLGVTPAPARVKCAELPVKAVHTAIQ